MVSSKTDIELVELFKEGSQPAFEELYVRYKNRLLCVCQRFLKNKTDSESVIQDVFLKLWEIREELDVKTSFPGYLHRLVSNRVLNVLREYDVRSRYGRSALAHGNVSDNATEEQVISNDYAELLDDFVESLPPRQKEIFRLSRVDGLMYSEISRLLGISLPAVQKHASSALKNIREHFKLYGDIHLAAIVAAALVT